MVTGPMPKNPKATRPKAKIGAANLKASGSKLTTGEPEYVAKRKLTNMSTRITRPIQKADMLPATKPERMLRDAPPCFEQLVTSRTWREVVLTKTLVNSGINAPATVPQLMMADNTHHKAGWDIALASLKSPKSTLL